MRLIFLFIFLISSSFALSIDKTWYENKKEDLDKLYSEQSSKISSSKNDLSPEDKEQVEYQLLLLKKLQSIIKEENTFIFKNIEEIEKALQTKKEKKELKKYVEVMPITVTTPAKIKVNTKRTAVNNVEAIEVDEILVIEQQMEDEYKNEYKKLAA